MRLLLLLLFSALAIGYANRTPDPVAATADPGVFSAERAMRHVREIAREPHPAGSPAHARVREYIVAELRQLGATVEIQDTIAAGTRYPDAGRIQNIVARIPGTGASRRAVLLMAHYDGVPAGPAAADDASGCAAILESLRAIRAGPPPARDIIVLIADAEEAGLLGAAGFVRGHRWARDVAVIMNFEARGVHGPAFMFETGAGNLDIVRVLSAVPNVRATSLSTTVYRELPNDTDLSEMMALGQPALNFAFIGGVQRYHTLEDDVAHLSRGSLQHHGDQALALTRLLANGDLPRPRTGDAVFFDMPLIGLTVYPASWALPIGVLALGLSLFAAWRAARGAVRGLLRVVLGFVGAIVSLGLAALVANLVMGAVISIHAGMDRGGSPTWSSIYAAAVAFLATGIVFAITALAQRWSTRAGLAAGALVLFATMALLAAILAPGASFLFVWPVILASGALALAPANDASSEGRTSLVGVILSGGALVVAIFMIVPTAYASVAVALGLADFGAMALALLVVFLAWIAVPVAIGSARRWLEPTLHFATAAVLFAIGAATVRTSATSPAGSSVTYAFDADSGRAWLAGSATSPDARRWMGSVLDSLADAERRAPPAWVSRRFAEGLTHAVDTLGAPPMIVEQLADSVAGGRRSTTLRVSAPGARSIALSALDGSVAEARVGGVAIDRSRYRFQPARWQLELVAPPDTGFVLELTMSDTLRVALGAMARHSGVPAALRVQRPPGILPIHSGDVTLVYRRLPVQMRDSIPAR